MMNTIPRYFNGIEKAIALRLVKAGFNWIGIEEEDRDVLYSSNNCLIFDIDGGIEVEIDRQCFTLPTVSSFWTEEDNQKMWEQDKAIALAIKIIEEECAKASQVAGQLSLFEC